MLAAPLDDLESALAATRQRRNPDPARAEPPDLWRRPTAGDLLTALDHADPHDDTHEALPLAQTAHTGVRVVFGRARGGDQVDTITTRCSVEVG